MNTIKSLILLCISAFCLSACLSSDEQLITDDVAATPFDNGRHFLLEINPSNGNPGLLSLPVNSTEYIMFVDATEESPDRFISAISFFEVSDSSGPRKYIASLNFLNDETDTIMHYEYGLLVENGDNWILYYTDYGSESHEFNNLEDLERFFEDIQGDDQLDSLLKFHISIQPISAIEATQLKLMLLQLHQLQQQD